ncbi:hypothetical protein [Amycolatopsis suaedae]|uniref:Acyltransferase n=1 Tax=Amycolatopsis suaedae TaxID=2510978 RepID=A0A4Q7J4Z8_9PSEU|nr:hypothetical protein [Amycolatopsis suaedae]RZQ62139.1 hypothetical protein EWH70_21430 [Amycolatopsis suaedae]
MRLTNAEVLLRAGGMVLAGYGYLAGLWLDTRDTPTPPGVTWLREWVARPLGLGEDFGPLGLLLMLVAAGYLTARRGRVDVALFVLAGLTVAGYLLPATRDLVAVTGWTVLLVVIGFGGVAVTGLLPRPARWLGPLTQLVLALAVVAATATAAPGVAAAASFYPLVVAGQLIAGCSTGDLRPWTGGLLGTAGLAVVALAEHLVPTLDGWWYPVAATYAGLLGAVAVLFAGPTAARLATLPPVRWAATRAWELVLLAVPVGHPLLDLLTTVPFAAAFPLAVLGVAAAAEVVHQLTRLSRRKVPA